MSSPDQTKPAVLALDATGAACSVAVLRADGVCFTRVERMERGHAERLFPLIDEALAEASLTPGEIGVFAAARGPGSFTGVRIGVAAARGLALAVGARAVGVDGFFAIAAAAFQAGLRCESAVVVFGRPPRLVARRFAIEANDVRSLGEMGALSVEGDASLELLVGPAAEAAASAGFAGRVDSRFSEIDPAVLARLARDGGEAVGPPSPIYLRPPDAEPSREARPQRLGPRAEASAAQ